MILGQEMPPSPDYESLRVVQRGTAPLSFMQVYAEHSGPAPALQGHQAREHLPDKRHALQAGRLRPGHQVR